MILLKQVPHDEKGRPYPYVLPPTFPGAYPTIAFMGKPFRTAPWKCSMLACKC